MRGINEILPLREQAAVQNQWLKIRLDTIIPEILERENMDMWIVICREYNEDPVIMSLLPAESMAARRRTVLVFARNEDTVERLTLSRYGYEGFYEAAWDPDEEDQLECLGRIVRERDPKRIGINASRTFAFGDGISHTEFQLVSEALGEPYASRLITAEKPLRRLARATNTRRDHCLLASDRDGPPDHRARLLHRSDSSGHHDYR